jgi:hypothetical protein
MMQIAKSARRRDGGVARPSRIITNRNRFSLQPWMSEDGMAELKGGCQCGAVRYESTGDVLFAGHCQCTDCQKSGGGGHSSIFAVPKDGVTMTGETKVYEVTADSGNTVGRGFCPRCGGPIFTVSSGLPGVIMFKAGGLDDPEQFKPAMVIYTKSGPGWDQDVVNGGLPTFEAMPPMG